MAWQPIPIESWSHLVETFSQLDYGRPSETSHLFRGQSDKEWDLVDTLSRMLEVGVLPEKALEIEQMAFEKFFTQAHFFLDPSTLPKRSSILAWWATMQHFGCPTRLLDWTSSPYVATYFAAAKNWECDGAVWAFDPCAVLDANDSPDFKRIREIIESTETGEIREVFWGKRRSDFVYPYSLRKHHIRIATQQASFTVCGTFPRDHGLSIDQSFYNREHGHTLKIIIRSDLKPDFLRKLLRMNITANSLFPGLDGLGRSISDLVRLETNNMQD